MLEQFRDRMDIDKFAHPEIVDTYEMADVTPLTTNGAVYDQSVPFEERAKAAMATEEMFREAMGAPRGAVEVDVPGCPEEPDATTHITWIRPKKLEGKKLPALLVIPGGALYNCTDSASPIADYAKKYQALVAVVRYRTTFAPGGGYPGTLNDCHAAYQYLVDNAAELNIDPKKIVIIGMSTGGHLALALAHRLKRYGITPRGVQAIGGIADDRTGDDFPSTNVREVAWNGEDLRVSSKEYLGWPDDDAPVSPEAFANRATVEECVGLAPHSLHVFDGDPSLDANLQYCSKLVAAGVFVNLSVWGGCNHEALINAYLTEMYDEDGTFGQRFIQTVDEEVKEFFKHDLTRK